MSFTKITTTELNSRGATTLPNQPAMSATILKQEFDAPAKNIVAPKFNNLVDELEATTAAASLGAVAPTGRVGNNVQGIMNSISTDLDTLAANTSTAIAEAHAHPNKALLDDYTQTEADLADAVLQKHSHPNKAVIDKFADDGTGITYDGNPVGAVTSVNSQTGAVVLTASDVGALPSTTAIPTKTSDLTNDSNFVADASYVHTDNNYDATAKAIVDGATAAIAAKSTVAWNQNITTGQRIATVTIDGTPTDVYAPTGGGGGGGAVDSVNGQTGIVTLRVGDLDDVSISSLASQQTIVYDGTEWGNEALADVALSGSYNDLSDQPTIPTVDQTYSATSGNAQSGTAVAEVVEQIYADNGVLGAKNLLPSANANQTSNGISYTVNADGSVTANGTATADSYFAWNTGLTLNIEINEVSVPTKNGYTISGCNDAENSKYYVGLTSTNRGYIVVKNGITVSNKVFYPMLRLASDPDDTYVPYAMTNRELTEKKLSISEAQNNYYTKSDVDAKLQRVVQYAGTKQFSDLTSSLLNSAYVNNFFMLTNDGEITSANINLWNDNFIVGDHIPKDSHIAVIAYTGSDASKGSYVFDDFGGFVETDEYTASQSPVNGVVTFSDLNPDYGYKLYVDIPDETSSLPTNLTDLPVCKWTKVQRSTKADGTITLAYTVTNTNVNYCLRILK